MADYIEGGIMLGKGQLGIKRIPATQAIPKQSPAATRTTGGVDIKKKMAKVMGKVMKGC
jgi:hypothetical protein